MSYFSHFHATTHHHPTLLYVTLHCSTLLTLHCSRLFALLYAAFNLALLYITLYIHLSAPPPNAGT